MLHYVAVDRPRAPQQRAESAVWGSTHLSTGGKGLINGSQCVETTCPRGHATAPRRIAFLLNHHEQAKSSSLEHERAAAGVIAHACPVTASEGTTSPSIRRSCTRSVWCKHGLSVVAVLLVTLPAQVRAQIASAPSILWDNDRSLCFHRRASRPQGNVPASCPKAKSVWVKCVAVGLRELKHDSTGVWTYTSPEPVAPECYSYAFVVDDTRFSRPCECVYRAIAGFSMGAFMRATFQRPIPTCSTT